MNKARVNAILKRLKPRFDMPLVIEQDEAGYHDARGRLVSEGKIQRMISRRTLIPSLPELVVIDLRNNLEDESPVKISEQI